MADNKDIIKCPACGKTMTKVYIASVKKHIDICLEGCGGIYFDNRELELFDEEHENIDAILNFYNNKKFSFTPQNNESDEIRMCPLCNKPMVKTGNGTLDNSFKIDCCYSCGGKFLDSFELQKMRAECGTEEERSKVFNAIFALKYGSNI